MRDCLNAKKTQDMRGRTGIGTTYAFKHSNTHTHAQTQAIPDALPRTSAKARQALG